MRWRWNKPAPVQGKRVAGPDADATVASGERSIAINTQGAAFTGVATTGDHTTIIHVPREELRPPADIDAPLGLINLPGRCVVFVGRERELGLLDTALDGAGTAVVQALHGLGGVGKSALAAHWAATRAGVSNPVWWITADNPANLDAGLAALAAALQPALAQLPAEQLAERAMQWLATHTGWLLILDNVDNPDQLAPLIARATTGRILITSRRATGWYNTAIPIPLDVLAPNESIDLLTHIITHGGRRTADAAELCHELGHLPLAIEQAGAYITQTGITPGAYLRLLADHPSDMYRETAEGRDRERTVARVWRITLDRLADTPLAGHILRVIAWWAPSGIPRSFLDPIDRAPEVHRAIGRLAAYNMITMDVDSLAVHRLVQALARTPDNDDPHRQAADISVGLHHATALLLGAHPASPYTPRTWAEWRTLTPHVDALSQHTPSGTDTPTTADLFHHVGVFHRLQGEIPRATAHLERALACRVRMLGENHRDTLTTRNDLANVFQSTGDLSRAIPLHKQNFTDMMWALGLDHPDTLTACNNLATAYELAGDLRRAIFLHEQNFADRARVLGEDDPDTLASRNNLASAYQSAGDLHRALPLYEQNLEDMTRALGEDHPDTLASRNNLASAYQSAGDLHRAILLHQETLAGRARVLGEDHHSTLASRNNLAIAYESAGDLRRAIPLYEQTFAGRARLLGEDHPDTITASNNLAGARRVGSVR
ncbi:tetratricopeptide repeat protein [Kitasatospora sp. NPDC008115]|uniref:tetratricopeptide repeat protein n=1 Tax=Kitasatospora sp. NPDC008115 TaxID=3364022 RepID=UPI0036E196CC